MSARLKRLWRFTLRETAAAQPPSAGPRGSRELQRWQAVVNQLRADTRRVFTLRKVYELSVPDIAARLGLSAHDVEQHLVAAVLAFDRAAQADRPRVRPTA